MKIDVQSMTFTLDGGRCHGDTERTDLQPQGVDWRPVEDLLYLPRQVRVASLVSCHVCPWIPHQHPVPVKGQMTECNC